ncbi:MAG TPA: aldehyde dehydrogenase family protein, partial [Ardenticatenaceae bacterium]|nr:aldehyde dehydrogenase family protein [Ardenticatenaceae bacterium]
AGPEILVRSVDEHRLGIFRDVDGAATAARRANEQYERMSLEARKVIIAAMREQMRKHGDDLAREAHEETGLGRAEDKIRKNRLVTEKTPGPEILETTAWSGDDGLTIVERAPFGVVAAITPTTNPTSTIINNSISILSAGNAVCFNVHPNARRVSAKNIQLLNQAIQQAGGPANLITGVAEPTIESAQALMRHPLVRLLLVTGGGGVVQEAMRSGKRAITAGPGNPPVVVDETADLELAAEKIIFGASFDNNVICTDEKEVFVVDKVADALKMAMQRHGAHLVERSHEIRRLEETIFREIAGPYGVSKMRNEWIGKNAGAILQAAGIDAPRDTRLAFVEVPLEHTLVWTEQMMPVLPLVRLPNVDQCIDQAIKAEHGYGHTASIFSRHLDPLSRMARESNVSIFVKNGPTLAGLGYGGQGYTSFSIASPTGEGLTTALSFSRPRRCTLVDHFRIV